LLAGVLQRDANVGVGPLDSARNALPGQGESATASLTRLKAERLALAVERERGNLLDRREAERLIFERARAERDAHLAFVSRIAVPLAAETGADPSALFAALDREMRAHLAELAATPFAELRR
jgi:hypothetical protein